ncbi:hypothetical protein XM25_19765 [Devosia sp. H5989]|nr:hypothetical protein XM25_19765 [Devosia sp. H5989]
MKLQPNAPPKRLRIDHVVPKATIERQREHCPPCAADRAAIATSRRIVGHREAQTPALILPDMKHERADQLGIARVVAIALRDAFGVARTEECLRIPIAQFELAQPPRIASQQASRAQKLRALHIAPAMAGAERPPGVGKATEQ